MYLVKRNNGYFYAYYFTDGKPQKKSLKTKDKTIAQQRFGEFSKYGEFAQKKFIPKQVKKFTLGEAVKEYLKYSEGINTYKSYKLKKRHLSYFVKYFSAEMYIEDISPTHITEYLRFRLQISSVYQARLDYINIRAMFYHYLKLDRLSDSPILKVKMPKIPDKQPLYFTREEFEIVLKNSQPPMREIILFGVNTGLRLNELLSLRDEDIDHHLRCVTVGKHLTTKSKKTRVIPLNDEAYSIVADRKGILFPFGDYDTTHKFKKLIRACPVNQKLHFHSLRHTFASWLIQSGVSVYVISKLLGHSSVLVTSVYSHLELSDLSEATKKIKGV